MHGVGRSPQWISLWWNNVNHTKQTKKSILYLVRTKASELVDFPDVNTPLECNTGTKRLHIYFICKWTSAEFYINV